MKLDSAVEAIHSFKQQLPADRPLYVAIGVFDGVHLGHQTLLEKTVADARARDAVSFALTFDPHPLQIVAGGRFAPRLLTSMEDRLYLLRRTGIDHVLVVPFTPWLAQLEPECFVADILAATLGVARIYVGFSFTFGRGGRGTPELLRELGQRWGIEVVEFPPVRLGDTVVSSTQIREALQKGDVASASTCLGRPFLYQETVVHGDARGRTLGFPTANLPDNGSLALPADGVYAVAVGLESGELLGGVANLGRRPTITEHGDRLLEVHLLDFKGDLYGQSLRVAFLDFIRSEQRFTGLDELKQTIARDAREALAIIQREWGRLDKQYLSRRV